MAAEVLTFRECWTDAAVYGLPKARRLTRTTGWDEHYSEQLLNALVKARLDHIAHTWVNYCAQREVSFSDTLDRQCLLTNVLVEFLCLPQSPPTKHETACRTYRDPEARSRPCHSPTTFVVR